MKPKSVVTCLPSKHLEQSLIFYRECFGLSNQSIDEEMIVIELGNLSLFLMSEASFAEYTDTISLTPGYPTTELHVMHSCAVEDGAELDRVFSAAEAAGGSVAKEIHVNEWDQKIGYIRDPDSHVWELMKVDESA